MAYDFNGTTGRIDFRTATTNFSPSYSIGCWFNADVNNVFQGLVSIQNIGAGRNAHLALSDTGAVMARPRSGQGNDASTTTTIATGTWYHGLATFTTDGAAQAGSASRTAYLNGGGAGTNSTTVTLMDNCGAVNIGSRLAGSTRSEFFNGRIAEVAVWNAALTASDALALASGVRASLVRPDKLVFYAPLIRNIADFRQGIANTTAGSPAVDIHPRRVG